MLLPQTTNSRLLRWAKQDHVQNIFKSWHDMYNNNLPEETFLKLAQITYKIHVKGNIA